MKIAITVVNLSLAAAFFWGSVAKSRTMRPEEDRRASVLSAYLASLLIGVLIFIWSQP